METEMRIEDGVIHADVAVPMAARLFGVPFLAMGCYLLYTLTLAIAAAVNANGTVGDIIGGQFLHIVFMLSFGGPGVLLVFGGRTVVFDKAARAITERRKLGFIKLTSGVTPLKDVACVRATQRVKADGAASFGIPGLGGGDTSLFTYDVELLNAQGTVLVLAGLFNNAADAVTFSTKVADTLALPFENRTKSDPDTDDDGEADSAL